MPTNSICVATRQRLRDLIADGLPGVQVEYAWPAKQLQPRAVWLGRLRSTIDIETFKANRKNRVDEFDVDVWCAASGRGYPTAEAADAAAEELVHAVEDVLADDPTLGALDGLQWAMLTAREGDPDPTDDGWAAAIRLTISCRARLT